MTALDETRARYGVSKDVAVKTFDYSSIPTCDLLRRVEELRARVKESDDVTLEDSLDVNELFALESELGRRVKDGEEDVVTILRIASRGDV
ncbi:MAG TPA: hypothetical protein VGB32_03110 [Candidatus Bathyarchaeia archaeon]